MSVIGAGLDFSLRGKTLSSSMSDNITGTKKSLSIPGDGTLLVKELCLIISTKRKKNGDNTQRF